MLAIIAGTPVDVEFGVKYFSQLNTEMIKCPISKGPKEQTKFQEMDFKQREEYMIKVINDLANQGAKIIVIYCNSLSGSLDVKKIEQVCNIPIITPLEAYDEIAMKYNKVALLCANTISLFNIQNYLQNINDNLSVLNFASIDLIIDIEKQPGADKIIEDYALTTLIDFFLANKVDKIIFGCTHFDYVIDKLKDYSDYAYSPSEYMLNRVKELVK